MTDYFAIAANMRDVGVARFMAGQKNVEKPDQAFIDAEVLQLHVSSVLMAFAAHHLQKTGRIPEDQAELIFCQISHAIGTTIASLAFNLGPVGEPIECAGTRWAQAISVNVADRLRCFKEGDISVINFDHAADGSVTPVDFDFRADMKST